MRRLLITAGAAMFSTCAHADHFIVDYSKTTAVAACVKYLNKSPQQIAEILAERMGMSTFETSQFNDSHGNVYEVRGKGKDTEKWGTFTDTRDGCIEAIAMKEAGKNYSHATEANHDDTYQARLAQLIDTLKHGGDIGKATSFQGGVIKTELGEEVILSSRECAFPGHEGYHAETTMFPTKAKAWGCWQQKDGKVVVRWVVVTEDKSMMPVNFSSSYDVPH